MLGGAVIALCYGFARYAYGLFVPRFSETFDLDPVAVGALSAASTVGYVVGLLVAPAASAHSARATTVVAGSCATIGLAVMAVAPGVVSFASGIVVAGAGAGLASPGVAQLIVETVRRDARTRAQTWANTGTGAGLALTAFTPLLPVGWRPIWLGFAVLAAISTAVAAWSLPRAARSEPATGPPAAGSRPRPALLLPLLLNSALLGAVSAPYWTFSISRVGEAGLSPAVATWSWCAIGLVGLAGGTAGRAVERYGLRATGLAIWTTWSAGIALLALPAPGPVGAMISAGVFGAGFMALTGLCILWGARLFPAAPSQGVTWSFLALGIGQTAGSSLAGTTAGLLGLGPTFALTGLLALVAWTQMHPRLAPPARADVDELMPTPPAAAPVTRSAAGPARAQENDR
ncbi:putative MFS family arabinose efflux permease [Pseudonocardia autotrophica]|uniref:Major Facilitator Superfamily protein n=2 Tax=Pseudonocardia TaxID=1847 RepID=A0A1Y2MWX1_PSEAH|nr:Major Facilitator Superfamily protein [Pseudonocardia autotrophica]TDN72810.1 putative MFS family arabinose efflux permease [Pseudonocardia autotrophica]